MCAAGGVNAQSTTPGESVDINVTVSGTCEISSPSLVVLQYTEEYRNDQFFEVTCNKDLSYTLIIDGPGVYNEDMLSVPLTNEKGSVVNMFAMVSTPSFGDYIYSRFLETGTGQKQYFGFRGGQQPNGLAEIGLYTNTLTATLHY